MSTTTPFTTTPLMFLQYGVRDNTTIIATSPQQQQPTLQRRLAYHYIEGSYPIVIFLPGYRSTMTGTKALTLENHCRTTGRAFCRFDYQGHGATAEEAAVAGAESTTTMGNNNSTTTTESLFMNLTLGDWIQDSLAIVNHLTNLQQQQQERPVQSIHDHGPTPSVDTISNNSRRSSSDATNKPSILLVGSSMGVWIALHVALQLRHQPELIVGIVGMAAAVDFTYDLKTYQMSKMEHDELNQKGVVWRPSVYDNGRPYPFSKKFLDESERWMLLQNRNDDDDNTDDIGYTNDTLISVSCPVRLLHGQHDEDIPYTKSMQLCQRLANASVTLIPDGDHRLSAPDDLRKMIDTIEDALTQRYNRENVAS